jgi:hypothetical protein
MSSRPPATASGPSEIENCLVKHPAVANARSCPSPMPSAARSSRRTSSRVGPRRLARARA